MNIFGWTPTESSTEGVVFFQLNGIQLALFPQEALADDAGVSPEGSGFRRFSMAHNVGSEKEVLDARAYLYKPDRIVFDGEQVVLLEFKTPPPEPEHRNRLDHYAVRFRQLGYKKVKCVLYYFDTQDVLEWQYGNKPAAQLGLRF